MNYDQQQLQDSRQKILEVATKMFAEKGYSNVSVRDICKAANVTPPMIYYYFRNKKGLFNAVTRHKITMKEFIERLRHATAKGDVAAKIRSFNQVYLASFPEDAFRVGFYIKEDASLDKESARKVAESFDEIMKILELLIQEGIERGQFKRYDAKVSADMLLGLLNHVLFQKIHFERQFQLDRSVEQVTEFFLRAMR
ncbi:MAG: TetR/AcrR family transcriptional regulator [Conexivisphaerales archaeon]